MYTIDTSTIWQCISSFFGLVGGALRLDPDVFRAVQTSPGANLLTLLILILAGVSVSLGQSVILFANKVTPRRFLMSLLLNGVLFAVGVLIWAAILLLVGRIVFRVQLPFDQMGREVSLAYAPLLLGFFVLLPYAGSFLKHAFEIWSFLAILVAALSPFESLGWWAGWFGHPAGKKISVPVQEPTETQRTEETAHYLVYLSGIGAISGDYLEPTEIELCDELAARFPGTVVVKNVFPYAMNNRGLTGHRIFSSLWRGIERLKIEGKERLL